MKIVTITYYNDEGKLVELSYELSDVAICDLITFCEVADGNDEYEKGDFDR